MSEPAGGWREPTCTGRASHPAPFWTASRGSGCRWRPDAVQQHNYVPDAETVDAEVSRGNMERQRGALPLRPVGQAVAGVRRMYRLNPGGPPCHRPGQISSVGSGGAIMLTIS